MLSGGLKTGSQPAFNKWQSNRREAVRDNFLMILDEGPKLRKYGVVVGFGGRLGQLVQFYDTVRRPEKKPRGPAS